ncbi:MAG: GNAT family N-acetyltransferase [Bacilli bacterium]|nr:GNAT family N-acetyltransferase [Bacilli bacterium]MDD4808436.1 GNAT family N-acetyltransferase [Bacilli bacterium]
MIVIKQSNVINEEKNKIASKYDFYYNIFNDDVCVGYAAISINSNDMLYIYIIDEYRGNHFGKEVFNELLKEFKKYDVSKINIMVDSKNIQFKRIISHKQAAIVHRNSKLELYEVKI